MNNILFINFIFAIQKIKTNGVYIFAQNLQLKKIVLPLFIFSLQIQAVWYHLFYYIQNMLTSILKNSISDMKKDRKIIRLTLATSFFHSLIASLLILLNINTLFARNYENWLYVGKVAEFFVQEINTHQVISRVLGIAILTFLAYSIIYPIGQAAIIYYLNEKDPKKKTIRHALKEGRNDFFPMFEFGIASLLLSPTVYRLTMLKIIISDWWLHWWAILVLLIWFIVMITINALKVHTRYIMTLEKIGIYESFIKSCTLSMKNIKESFKYIRIQTILLINFTFNLVIIYAVPLLLIYLAIVFKIIQYWGVKWTVYGLFFFWILFGAYASSIVRAFFAYFWQEIYHKMSKTP